MNECYICIYQKAKYVISNVLEILSGFITIISFLTLIYFSLSFFSIVDVILDENVKIAILTSAGIIAGISASIWYSQRSNRKKQESLLKGLALLLLQLFEISESYKDSFLLYQRNSLINTALVRYSHYSTTNQIQNRMKIDANLALDIETTINSSFRWIYHRNRPVESGFPFFLLDEVNLEIFLTSINEILNGISTTKLKVSLFNIKSKISLCNRYILDNTIPPSRFGRLLAAILDLDKSIQKSLKYLHEFGFIRNFSDLKKVKGYNTLSIRRFR